jgi:aryl-alcohol dehydrogenase-like predicted oxidoreductase
VAGTTTWSPLASGLLSGKYSKGVIPEGSRLSHPQNAYIVKGFEKKQTLGGLDVDGDDVYPKVRPAVLDC